MTSATNNGFGMATATALGEKAEMQFLNNKLAEYMNRVKQYTNISFRCMAAWTIYSYMYTIYMAARLLVWMGQCAFLLI